MFSVLLDYGLCLLRGRHGGRRGAQVHVVDGGYVTQSLRQLQLLVVESPAVPHGRVPLPNLGKYRYYQITVLKLGLLTVLIVIIIIIQYEINFSKISLVRDCCIFKAPPR